MNFDPSILLVSPFEVEIDIPQMATGGYGVRITRGQHSERRTILSTDNFSHRGLAVEHVRLLYLAAIRGHRNPELNEGDLPRIIDVLTRGGSARLWEIFAEELAANGKIPATQRYAHLVHVPISHQKLAERIVREWRSLTLIVISDPPPASARVRTIQGFYLVSPDGTVLLMRQVSEDGGEGFGSAVGELQALLGYEQKLEPSFADLRAAAETHRSSGTAVETTVRFAEVPPAAH